MKVPPRLIRLGQYHDISLWSISSVHWTCNEPVTVTEARQSITDQRNSYSQDHTHTKKDVLTVAMQLQKSRMFVWSDNGCMFN